MSQAGEAFDLGHDGFPRVSGDEPTARSKARAKASFSPRERG